MIQGFTCVTPPKTALVTMNFLIFAQHISTINENLNQPEPGLPGGPCINIIRPQWCTGYVVSCLDARSQVTYGPLVLIKGSIPACDTFIFFSQNLI